MENAKLVSIYRVNNAIELTPNENGGTSGNLKGFRPIDNKKIVLNMKIDSDKLTPTIIKLFKECK